MEGNLAFKTVRAEAIHYYQGIIASSYYLAEEQLQLPAFRPSLSFKQALEVFYELFVYLAKFLLSPPC